MGIFLHSRAEDEKEKTEEGANKCDWLFWEDF